MKWYKANQGLIADEETGENIAVCYKSANAGLIAAAPEMLEALEWLLFHAENGRRWKTIAHRKLDFTDDEFEGRLRAVIKKAKVEAEPC